MQFPISNAVCERNWIEWADKFALNFPTVNNLKWYSHERAGKPNAGSLAGTNGKNQSHFKLIGYSVSILMGEFSLFHQHFYWIALTKTTGAGFVRRFSPTSSTPMHRCCGSNGFHRLCNGERGWISAIKRRDSFFIRSYEKTEEFQ
jgi:hypothetical protein